MNEIQERKYLFPFIKNDLTFILLLTGEFDILLTEILDEVESTE
jgi:hypothetical protein